MTTIRELEKKENGFTKLQLESESLRMVVSNLGCEVLSIEMPDRNGVWEDIALSQADPTHPELDSAYMGLVVGRVANRIGGASFELNGKTYELAKNCGPNTLHGGPNGLHMKLYAYTIEGDSIRFTTFSPDGEEGYPGNLNLTVIYRLEGNCFTITYEAICDADTILNLTNHMYYNLSGRQEEIWDHELQLKAPCYMPVDDTCLVTGEQRPVDGSHFDFRTFTRIGEKVDFEDPQIRLANGYDHAFVLEGEQEQIRLRYPANGRQVTISTDLPMVHVYTGNYLHTGAVGKTGEHYKGWSGIALETEFCPDSIHAEKEPKVILRKDATFRSVSSYRFEVTV